MKYVPEKHLFQYDQGVYLVVPDEYRNCTAHFYSKSFPDGLAMENEVVNGKIMCKIPNQMLVNAESIIVYAFRTGTNIMITESLSKFSVTARPKPPDFVLDPTDTITYKTASDLIADMQTAKSEEAKRVTAESLRASAETERASSETVRKATETERVKAESERAVAETARSTAETARTNSESSREVAESSRVKAETLRANAETSRSKAESSREAAEQGRAKAESDRALAEQARITAETERASAESERASAEQLRAAAETERAGFYEGFNSDLNSLKNDLTEQDARITALEQCGGADGKSAYQIAVDNGFTGTEAEWLVSLNGKNGYTPVKGVDYYTDAEKVEIVQAVIDAMGGTLIGAVDSNNIITLTGVLSNETYTVKYEMADGTVIDIGELALSEPEPEIINQIPISINSDGTPFVGTSGELGYKTGYRLSLSSGNESAQAGTEVTGFIPVTIDSVIRIKNIAYASDNTRGVVGYDANFTKLSTGGGIGLAGFFAFDDGNGVARSNPLHYYTHFSSDNLAYIRLCSTEINETSILTVDQEIV